MTRQDDTDAKSVRFAEFWKTRTSGDAVNVEHVRPFLPEPAIQLVGPAHRHAMIGLVAGRRVGNCVAKDRNVVVPVAFRHCMMCIRCRDQHIVPGGTEAPAQPFDVHLGTADAVREIPPEEVGDLHNASVAIRSNTLTQAATMSSLSRSVNAAEIGRRINEAATRSVTGRSTDAMSPHDCAYGAECSGT